MQELGLNEQDVYEMPGEIDYGDLKPVSDLSLPKLRFESWTPVVPPSIAGWPGSTRARQVPLRLLPTGGYTS